MRDQCFDNNFVIDVWTFYCYDDGNQTDCWSSWYHAQDDRTRGQHTQVFDALEQLEPAFWRRPLVRNLSDGLIEIIIRSDLQWRVFAFYWPSGKKKSVTIVLIGYHKEKVYNPPNAIKLAKKRMRNIKKGSKGTRPCDRPTDAEEV